MTNGKQSIAKSATLVTIMMLSFKILGFVKQAVIAYYYGATFETDTYFIAWGFISGVSEAIIKALSVSIVAIYTMLRVKKGKKEAAKLVNGLVEIIFPVFLAIMLFLIITAPFISKLLAPSYDAKACNILTSFIRILAPTILFSSFELIFGAVLDSHKSFFVPRLQSFIYSIATILACIFLSSLIGINALIVAQYTSYILFTFLVIFSARKYHQFFAVKIREIPELSNILFTAIPLFIGNSALQINQIVDKSITSGLGSGAASALSYCHTLEQFVTNIMIVNIGNIMFANFAEYVAQGNLEKIKATLQQAINVLICLLLAISIITIICANDIVSIVYYRGNFSQEAVVLTATALVGYALSFVAVAVRDLSVKSLYAFKDTKRPMIASIISICINIAMSIFLSRYIGILGVSLATSISAVVGMIINAFSLKLHLKEYKYLSHFKTFMKCLPAGAILSGLCVVIARLAELGHFWTFLLCCLIGFPLYFFSLWVIGVSEVRIVFTAVKKKIVR